MMPENTPVTSSEDVPQEHLTQIEKPDAEAGLAAKRGRGRPKKEVADAVEPKAKKELSEAKKKALQHAHKKLAEARLKRKLEAEQTAKQRAEQEKESKKREEIDILKSMIYAHVVDQLIQDKHIIKSASKKVVPAKPAKDAVVSRAKVTVTKRPTAAPKKEPNTVPKPSSMQLPPPRSNVDILYSLLKNKV